MLKRKLRARRGETLTEILAAILICGFAILLLSGMMTTAMSINREARDMDTGADGSGGFYGALSEVETHAFSAADHPVQVKLSGTGLSTVTLTEVYTYTQGDSAPLTVYGKVVGP